MTPPRLAAHAVPPMLAFVLALLAGTPALGQSSPWYVAGSVNLSRESNLLRLVDGQEAPAGYSKSDRITSTALLAGLDQGLGRQRLYGNVALRANRFSDNPLYNNHSYSAAAGLDWSSVERLSGSLSASASRNLASFNLQEIGLLTEKNLESVQALDGTLRWGLMTRYSLEATAGRRRVTNSLDTASVQARDFFQDTGSLGLRWNPSAVSSLGLALRSTQGHYPRFRLTVDGYEADRYKRHDIDFTASYRPSGASSLNLRLSNGKTAYDLATQRNYSGLTGALGWSWQTSGKVRLNTSLVRDTGQDSYAVTTFFGQSGTTDYSRITTSLRLKADYEVSAKISMNLALGRSDRDLVQTQPGLFSDVQASGRDRYTTLALGARWIPYRSFMLGCDASTERRRGSGQLGSDLKAATYGCYGQFTLQ